MKVTKENANSVAYMHQPWSCEQEVKVGPRGGKKLPTTYNFRVGRVHTYVRGEKKGWTEIGLKRGMFNHFRIILQHEEEWHSGRAEDCSLGSLRPSIHANYPGAFRYAEEIGL